MKKIFVASLLAFGVTISAPAEVIVDAAFGVG